MNNLDQIQDLHRSITLHRRKGDALVKMGRVEEANAAFDVALSICEEALERAGEAGSTTVGSLTQETASEMAEILGMRGGLLRRKGRLTEAFRSYEMGAALERDHQLSSTYDRANAIKLGLIAGLLKYDEAALPLRELQQLLEMRLSTDERAADDAWSWADLGDVRLLLGDEEGALEAYRSFGDRSRTTSPLVTVSVLEEIVRGLVTHNDPGADALRSSVERVKASLTPAS